MSSTNAVPDYMNLIALSDGHGRWKCTQCGKFRKLTDFEHTTGISAWGKEVITSIMVVCKKCGEVVK